MKKKRIWIALGALGVALLWCTAAMAARSGKYGSLSWTLDNEGTLKITGTGTMNNLEEDAAGSWLSYRSEIKNVIIGNGITSIGNSAFLECENIQSISVPGSVKRIGTLAFCWCSALTEITLPDAITAIPTEAFYHCTALKNLTLPKNVTSISEDAFSWCSALTEIVIPKGVTSLPRNAFYCCENLTGITLPEGISSIGDYAFSGCSSLTDITFPESLNRIGEEAFLYCTSLRNVIFPKKMVSIGKSAFYNCCEMSGIIIPEGLTRIEEMTFGSCVSLTSVVIPEGVTHIGKEAFFNCYGVTDVTLPDSVISIGEDAFGACSATIYARTDTEIARQLSKSGYSFRDPDKKYSLRYLYDGNRIIGSEISQVDTDIVSFTFPEGVVSIASDAFRFCSMLENLVVPDGVTSIGHFAFDSCYNLSHVVLPDSVTWIGDNAFYDCQNLKSINLPAGLTEISMFTFAYCVSLENVTIPEGVTEIGRQAFYKCRSLTDLVIPGSVNAIDYWAFGDCSGLRSVVLQEGVKTIGESAFIRSGLISINLPGSLTSIEKMAFRACSGLTSITIPAAVTSIDSQAFYFVSSLEKVVFLGNDIIFGDELFTSVPTVYCHQNSGVKSWALSMGYTVVALEGFSPDAERSVLLKDAVLYLDIGQSARLIPVIFPDYDRPQVIWASSDPSVASVTDGMVEALRYGKCTVTASAGAASASVEVDVHRLAQSISFPEEEIWVYYEDSLQLAPVIEPLDAETTLTWSAPYEDYASVDESGQVLFQAATDLTVTVSTENGLTASVLVHGCTRVTDVRLSDYTIKMSVGETRQLDAYVTMSSKSCVNQFVNFSSSDESIAAVESHGRITALGRGKTTIWVYCEDLAKYFWCDITVVNPVTSILTLPSDLTTVGSEAFANLGAGCGFIIPESVTYIADDAFQNTQATIIAPAGSYAARWVENHPELDWMSLESFTD